jgi:hypothetical protein
MSMLFSRRHAVLAYVASLPDPDEMGRPRPRPRSREDRDDEYEYEQFVDWEDESACVSYYDPLPERAYGKPPPTFPRCPQHRYIWDVALNELMGGMRQELSDSMGEWADRLIAFDTPASLMSQRLMVLDQLQRHCTTERQDEEAEYHGYYGFVVWNGKKLWCIDGTDFELYHEHEEECYEREAEYDDWSCGESDGEDD